MPTDSYLLHLTARLADGIARLPEECRARHASFLLETQNDDGGWSGREGGSDLYYTGFALRGLAVLDVLTPEVCARTGAFLKHSLAQHASVVDFFSLLYACFLVQVAGGPDVLAGSAEDWPERVAATLETFRTADGGYAKTVGGSSGSTYHTFLVGLCYQLLGRALPGVDDLARFLDSRRRADGGFVEIAPMRRGGTNPTAAAVGMLQIIDDQRADTGVAPLLPKYRAEVSAFLVEMASLEGGLRANARAPLADLLSTFTGAWTLHQLNALERMDRPQALQFAQALEMPDGGFRGGLWDEQTDVEYTFYGLGVYALLS